MLDPRPEQSATDLSLLRAHAAGDSRAFAEIYRRHHGLLMSTALRSCRNYEDAEDAVQDAMLSAHRAASTFRGGSSVRTWLYSILTNVCRDRSRRAGSRVRCVRLPQPGPLERIALQGSAGSSAAERVHDALRALNPDQRSVLLTVDFAGYSFEETAKRLSIPLGTTKSRHARARRLLARELRAALSRAPENRPGPEHRRQDRDPLTRTTH